MFDFLWYRDSGIRVNIGLERVNILPEYETVNYSTMLVLLRLLYYSHNINNNNIMNICITCMY